MYDGSFAKESQIEVVSKKILIYFSRKEKMLDKAGNKASTHVMLSTNALVFRHVREPNSAHPTPRKARAQFKSHLSYLHECWRWEQVA